MLKFINAARNIILLYSAMLLLKLIYFGMATGMGRLQPMQVFGSLGSVLILASLALLLKPAAAKVYMILLNAVLSFVIFSDIIFYRYFNDLISLPMLFQAGSLKDVQSSLIELIRWSDLIMAMDILFGPLILKYFHQNQELHKLQRHNPKRAIAACIAGSVIIYFGVSQLLQSQPTILNTFYDRAYVAQNIGLLNYHGADAYTFAMQTFADSEVLDEEKNSEIMDFFKAKNHMDHQGVLYGLGKDKNIIVIQMEAMQQFVINRSINGQEITPNLNKLASSSIYFDNYYYQTAGGGTSDAEFTANVSMFPLKDGAVYIRKPGNYYYSMARKLKENGFSTIALHGYKQGFWNRSVVYNNMAIDEFVSKEKMEEDELLGLGISDKSFFRQSLSKLKAQKEPYFAFLITLSSHFPYDNDKNQYSSFDVGEYKGTIIGDYLEAVHYTDEALGEFILQLEQEGMLKNTILAVYGDHHGIPKDNKNDLAKFLGKEKLTSLEWMKLQKVPMMIKMPGKGVQMKVSLPGGGVDFMPTLMNLAGIDISDMPYVGRDLINEEKGHVILRNGSFVTNDMIYLSQENKCYDVKSGESLPLERYQEQKQLTERYLDYSDTIIKFDLAEKIRVFLKEE